MCSRSRLLSAVASARFARNARHSSVGRVGRVGASGGRLLLHQDEKAEGRAGRHHTRKAFAVACLIDTAGYWLIVLVVDTLSRPAYVLFDWGSMPAWIKVAGVRYF